MLFQVGGQGSRPTFFEMSAAQQLPASLRAALTYSFGVALFSFIFRLIIYIFNCKTITTTSTTGIGFKKTDVPQGFRL